MVGESGQVLGVEKHKELAERSMTSLSQAVPELMKTGTVKIMPGNVLGKVLKEYGPFDAIHVGAAAATMPQVRAATCYVKRCCSSGLLMRLVKSLLSETGLACDCICTSSAAHPLLFL